MYADDSIMCCLFPNKCNMFPQTSVVIFSNTMEYLNMMIVLSSPIFVVWSLFRIMIQFIEEKDSKLIEHYRDSEDSCIEKQSLQNEIKTKCTDEYYSDGNNYDGDDYKSYSDSDLNLGPANSISRRLGDYDGSNSDVYNSKESSEDFIKNINMAASKKSCINSVKQYMLAMLYSFSCAIVMFLRLRYAIIQTYAIVLLRVTIVRNLIFPYTDMLSLQYSNSSSSDDKEDCNHSKDFEYRACTQSTSTVVVGEELLQAIQEDANNDKPKDTLSVSDTDSINRQQSQNKLSNHQT